MTAPILSEGSKATISAVGLAFLGPRLNDADGYFNRQATRSLDGQLWERVAEAPHDR